ncbi:hypothetical protein [Pontibacter mangrovi]|uniref:Tetratricopeptide repeat protein n=1 Tax=Pontibacter mangrovi TaxID=2589816 RepID=A0A501W8V6_9BACT|nr:hypothetical protein [Pontibacter mangrovi]TPE45788.1 hypothetical protein FJM65_00105 [Pontibacter mangrovi]
MNKSAFLQLIQQAANISDQQTEELEKVAATFPYCQTAHLLLAKSAYDKGSMLSTQRLRRASAYATNRQKLKRIIYTAPVAVPEFDESALEEASVQPKEAATTALTVVPEEPAAILPVAETLTQANNATDQPPAETALALDTVTETEGTAAPEEAAAELPAATAIESEDAASGGAAPSSTETKMADEEGPSEENVSAITPDKSILEQPMEKLDSELALLLTIKSLSPSFTDLLAQKPDPAPEAASPQYTAPPLALPPAQEQPEDKDKTERQEAQQHDPSKTEDDLASLISAEVAAAAKSYFETAETAEEPVPSPESAPEPEEAEVKYAFDEIDQMYQQDTLGYWMSSSRMGEVLQLKEDNELTRERPAAFHPELILEYSKTHELVAQEAQSSAPLHQQLDIIDQFLKLNPRLKALNNVKMKPEPQEDLSLKSTKIKRGVASESLANIFLKQGKAKKAIKIYEQLILKYPEKKSYFAEQIEKLQNLS